MAQTLRAHACTHVLTQVCKSKPFATATVIMIALATPAFAQPTIDATATAKHTCYGQRCIDCTDLTYEACADKALEVGILSGRLPQQRRPLESECGNTSDGVAYLNPRTSLRLQGEIICPVRPIQPRAGVVTEIPFAFLGTWCWDGYQCSPRPDDKAGEFYITGRLLNLNKDRLSCTIIGGEVRDWTLKGNANCYPDKLHPVPYGITLTLTAEHKLKVHMEPNRGH